MNGQNQSQAYEEKQISALNGWGMLALNFVLILFSIYLFYIFFAGHSAGAVGMAVVLLLSSMIMFGGYFILQPNKACLLIFFGKYKGTVRSSGFYWTNPLYSQRKVSLRSYNFNSDKLKVNDKRGNPIEIAAVVVWKAQDTAKTSFEVVDYLNYVNVQSESAVRHLASSFPYDHGEENETTLRGGGEEISQALKEELQKRLDKAGVVIEEARLTHLAYAPEIAQTMLRRQQAEAVIAARRIIAQGAVSIVEMALHELSQKQIVQLDEERKAAMVSNLLVVLCGESQATPVVNTGTLYT